MCKFTVEGWPEAQDIDITVYYHQKEELTVENGCLMWGIRVVVPTKLRMQLLPDLHHDHPGVWKIKAVAHRYFWWPDLDEEIEKHPHSCHECQIVKGAPPTALLHLWVWPTKPWGRVHLDFASPFQNATF